jgi:hypothetical protein
MRKLLLLIPLLGFCVPAMANSDAEFRYFQAIGQVYRNAAMPNQRGVCDYAKDAKEAALQLYDRELLDEVAGFQEKFDCNKLW